MAKKSNKTEHVLKLITKNDEDSQDDFFGIEPENNNKGTVAAADVKSSKSEKNHEDIKVEIEPDEKEPKYEAKKVEIQPEIEVKQKIELQPEMEAKQKKESEAPKKTEEPDETGKVLFYDNHVQEKEGSAYFEQHDGLVNIAEILAREKIALVMEKMKVCNCPTCVNDVLALTLNSLPTKYVTTDAGKQYFQLDIYKKQYETDVLAALTKACVRVKASPRH